MLKQIYIQFGIVGTFALVTVGTITFITWLTALAGVTASGLSRGKKLGMQALLTILPPFSLVVMGGYLVKGHREAKRIAHTDRMSAASIRERLLGTDDHPLTARIGNASARLVPAEV